MFISGQIINIVMSGLIVNMTLYENLSMRITDTDYGQGYEALKLVDFVGDSLKFNISF